MRAKTSANVLIELRTYSKQLDLSARKPTKEEGIHGQIGATSGSACIRKYKFFEAHRYTRRDQRQFDEPIV